ncbi:MAG: hypothetical protein HYX75_13590 [Acidobacteria bacterium]|nr:hypothetical protein [Acidobacteriota bacterium]
MLNWIVKPESQNNAYCPTYFVCTTKYMCTTKYLPCPKFLIECPARNF